MKIRLISIVCGIILLSSCNKFLDTKPQVVLTPLEAYQTSGQITAALAGIYTNLKYVYSSAYECEYTVATDESYYYNTGVPFAIYANTSSDNTTNNTAGFWKNCFQSIDYANTLLDNIDASAAIGHVDSNVVRRAKGEAYFMRGYYYFLLAQWFGGVPIELHASSDPTKVNIARASLSQVYNQIIADMTVADSLLYDQTFASFGYSERVTQEAVDGILARVCLYAAGQPNNDTRRYKDAVHWASKLINAGTHSLVPSYSQVFIDECAENYNTENIWEVGFNEKGAGVLSSGGSVGVICGVSNTVATSVDPVLGNIYANGYCYAYVKLHPRLFCSFQSGDYRRDWNVANYYFSSGIKQPFDSSKYVTKYWSRNPAKWRREYEPLISRSVQASSGTNFPLLRYSDVLLMLAEAENEVNGGPNDSAYYAINQVRERSISATPIIDRIVVTSPGSGYTSPPAVIISGGNGSGAKASATVTSGKLSFLLLSQGSGYTDTPTIQIGTPWAAYTAYDSGIQVTAPNGKLYTVTKAGTTKAIAPSNLAGSSNAAATGAVFTFAGTSAKVTFLLSPNYSDSLYGVDLPRNLSQADFRSAIQMERYHELANEALRLGDLRRWGILIPIIKGLAADINGTNTTYPQIPPILKELGTNSDLTPLAPINNIGPKDWYWPIPLYDLNLNNLLTQNPGY